MPILRKLSILAVLAAAWLPGCQPARGANLITATVTVTNVPSHGNSITVNGSTRTWVTNLTTPATQILIPGTGTGGVASNLWSHVATWDLPTAIVPRMPGTNAVSLRTQLDGPMVISTAGTWATVALSTNTTAVPLVTVRVPGTGEPLAVRRFVADELVKTISDNATSNTIAANAPAMANFVDTSENQTVGGDKTYSGAATFLAGVTVSNATVQGTVSGGKFVGATVSNATVHATGGTISGGTVGGTVSQLNGGVLAGNMVSNATFAGTSTGGTFVGPTVSNATVHATGGTITGGTVGGTVSQLNGGVLAGNTLSNATFAGTSTGGTFVGPTVSNATVYATGGTISGGTVGGTVSQLSGGVLNGNTASNLTAVASTTVADLRLSRTTWAPTAGGNTAAAINGSFARVTDPGGAFWLYGIAGGVDGRIVVIAHPGPNVMHIDDESASEGTAANRILTPSSGNMISTSAATAVLIYDGAAARWRLVSWLD